MQKYYKPSGEMSPVALSYFLLAAILILPVVAFFYAYATWFLPIIYIKPLLTVGFGAGIAFVMNKVVVLGKIRSLPKALLFGSIASLIAYYFHWVVWVSLLKNAQSHMDYLNSSQIAFSDIVNMLFKVNTILDLLVNINKTGTWSIGNTVGNGEFLYAVWLLEFLIIFSFGVIGYYGASKKPFCEVSDEWFKTRQFSHPFMQIIDLQSMVDKLESGDESLIDDLGKWNGETLGYSKFTVYESNHNESYVSLHNQIPSLEDDKVTYVSARVVEYLKMKDDLIYKIEERSIADALEMENSDTNKIVKRK